MSETHPDLQPEVAEVLQAEPDYLMPDVPVCVKEILPPVRVQQLPRKAGSTFTRSNVSNAAPLRILTADHYRASATLVCAAQKFRFAFSEAAAQDDTTMCLWPAATPLTVGCTTEVWVKADTAPADVSVFTERWAAGE